MSNGSDGAGSTPSFVRVKFAEPEGTSLASVLDDTDMAKRCIEQVLLPLLV